MNLNLYIIQKELEDIFHFETYITDPALTSACAYPLLDPDTDVFSEGPVYIMPCSSHDKRMNEFPNQTLKICPNYISIIFFKCLSGFVPIA